MPSGQLEDTFFAQADPRGLPADEWILGRLHMEAQAAALHESELAGYIVFAVVKHTTLASVIVQRLASRLGHKDVSSDLLRQIFLRLVSQNASLSNSFVADLVAIIDRDPACRRFLEPILYFKGFHAIQSHRFAHLLWQEGREELALYLQSRSSSIFQVDIHPSVKIGERVLLDHATGLVISPRVTVEDGVSILHNVSIDAGGQDDTVVVGHGTSLGAGSKIVGNVEIGPCVRVAAGSVLKESVGANRTVAGSPARIVAVTNCPEPTRSLEELVASKLQPLRAHPAVYEL